MINKNNLKDLFNARDQKMAQINIDFASLPDMRCIRCGQLFFLNVTRIKQLSKIASPTGQAGIININMQRCAECGWIFNDKEWEAHFLEIEKQKLAEKNLGDTVGESDAVLLQKN